MPSKPLTATLLTLAFPWRSPEPPTRSPMPTIRPVEKAHQYRPGQESPGFLVNLGPTGARAILKETSFVVKYVFPESPADGQLRIDDEITGANGKPFSKHTFGNSTA